MNSASFATGVCPVLMEPGGSELEPSLSQPDNPCLIVEDSQPDSAALEEDPDSNYRTLLARRLSNLQPTSHSPVLELISSPAGSKCSQNDSQTTVAQSNRQPSSANLKSCTVAEEPSQVLEVCSPIDQKRGLAFPNNKCAGEESEMESGVDSTTQSESGVSQFGLLKLSQSQCLDEGQEGREGAKGARGTGVGQSDSDSQQGELNAGRNAMSGSQNSTCKRSEVSSSCPSERVCREKNEVNIQSFLHTQGQDPVEGDSEVLSSQDDMFDAERSDTGGVDSTVSEPEGLRFPTSTPANSLHLLHLSGQGTLVQESLSQNSYEFVAPTQDSLSQTPLIVPNSPTGQDDELEPMDTSLPPNEVDNSRQREDEPMDMDQAPAQPGEVPKSPPAASTPISQNSPGFILEKTLPLPTEPELSHDVFVPTQSLDAGSCSTGSESQQKCPTATVETGQKPTPITSQSQSVGVADSFQLELSTNGENSVVTGTKELEEEKEEDSQATQIEEFGQLGNAGSDNIISQQTERKDSPSEPKKIINLPEVSQVPNLKVTKSSGIHDKIEEFNSNKQTIKETQSELHRSTIPAITVTKVVETIDLTKTGSLEMEDLGSPSNPIDSQQKLQAIDLTMSSSLQSSPPAAAHNTNPQPSSLASQSESLSVLSKATSEEHGTRDVVMESQPKSPDVMLVTSQTVARDRGNTAESCEADKGDLGDGMDEGEVLGEKTGGERSGLCLSLSQSQVLSPEPMEEEGAPSDEERARHQNESSACSPEPDHAGEDEGSCVFVVEESERTSQQKDAAGTLQPEKGAASGSSDPPLPEQNVPMLSEDSQNAKRQQGTSLDKAASSGNGSVCKPEGVNTTIDTNLLSEKPKGQLTKPADKGMEEYSGSKSPGDSSGEIPFHFTLPKEGELIRPVANVTPPLISQLKQTPRHSTPIEMSSFSERSAGDVTGETTMAASEITVGESGEETRGDLCTRRITDSDGKLSLRMKLVTPVEEGSPGSECFSLQKPTLSNEEGSVSKVTTVVKAVTSPSVFSRVCEVRRQVEAEEKALPSQPSTPTRGDLFNSPLSQERESDRDIPRFQAQRLRNLPRSNAVYELNHPGELSPGSQKEGSGPENVANSLAWERDGEEELHGITPDQPEGTASVSKPGEGEVSKKSLGQRAVSQQTSFDGSALPTLPSKLLHRAVSQQTSFEATEPPYPIGRGEPVTTPLRAPPGPSVRRHVRTIREVRTTVTRIITDVYYENGQEVERKVTEESEEPVVDCRVMENDISPSRTGSSVTSGDLADVSSLSSKTSSLQHSSSGASSVGVGPVRRTDFVIPSCRGAKSASPRRASGQQQRAHCGAGGPEWTEDGARALGIGPLTPLTPRGRGRRGRPPSRTPLSRMAANFPRDGVQGPVLSSSEDEPYTRVCQRGLESPGQSTAPDATSDTSGGSSSFLGLRVVAKWSSNGYFYSGCITRDSGEGRFRLLFDDSYECDVPGKDILLCDPIPLETEVTALSEDEYFSTGVVKGHKSEGSDFFYCVEKDGSRKWYGRMAVILSMEQGNRLREQYGLGPYEPASPLTKASDISLDNLVEGKRKRRVNTGVGGTPKQSSSDSPRTPGPSGKRKLISSSEDNRTPAKRGRKSTGPRTGQRVNACNTSGSGTDLPSDPSDLLETHGPLPQSASLFLGYAFLLTASSEQDRETNQPTSEGEEEYVQTAPYHKRYTEAQLEAGGGHILQNFSEEQCKAARQSILIADQHCRTHKYLLCVASGIPCVSHMWVRDCCHDNQLLNYRNYLLPAGMGLEGHIVEWHPRRSPFKALKVLLVLEEPMDFWANLLKIGGASSVCQYQTDTDSSDMSAFDLVVTDGVCPPCVLNRALSLDLPVVSPAWLTQSLICGERLDHSSHPQYRHDFSP